MKIQCKNTDCRNLFTPCHPFEDAEFCNSSCQYKWNRDHKQDKEELIDNVE